MNHAPGPRYLSSIGRLYEMAAIENHTMPRVNAVIESLGVVPAFTIDGINHFDAEQTGRILDHCKTIAEA